MSSPSSTPFLKRNEIFIVIALLGASLLQGICNIFDLGYAGQDFNQHVALFRAARQHWIFFNNTNPPGFYVFAAYVARNFSSQYVMEGVAGALLLVNIVSLIFWYGILRVVIVSTPLRIAAFAILTFLPVRVITSVVFASDALTALPLVLLITLVVAQIRAQSLWTQIVLGLMAGAVWCLALYTKFTFIALPLGVSAVCGLCLLRHQRWEGRIRLIGSVLLGSILPVFFGYWAYSSMKSAGNIHFSQTDRGAGMPWSDLLGIRKSDVLLLSGPEFTCDRPMDAAAKHSYVSLVHLGLFSDIWNFFQKPPQEKFLQTRPIDKCFPRERTRIAKALTPVSLAASLPITVVAILGVIYQLIVGLWRNFKSPSLENDLKIAILLMSGAMCAPPIIRLPYYEMVYVFGYWTPRLILPGLLGLIVLAFASLDELVRTRHPWLSLTILGYAVALSGIYLLIL